jgi:hypothetical protein
MSCSYEEYLEQLGPTRFYGAGLKRWTLAYLVTPGLLVPLFWSRSPAWVMTGYAAGGLIALTLFLELRRSSLAYWSHQAGRRLRSLRERNTYVEEVRVDALRARFDPDPELAARGVVIELDAAEKELQERRIVRELFPRWYGSVMFAVLGAGLKMVPESRKALEVFAVVAIVASVALVLKHIIDAVLEVPTTNFGGYVSLLRRAKRRLDHEALRREATIRPAA